jgi:repressor LexA
MRCDLYGARVYFYPMQGKYGPNNIRRIRKAQGVTLEDIVALLDDGTTAATLSKLELGQIALTINRLRDLARALRVPIGELLSDEDNVGPAVPVIGAIAAGNWAEAMEHPDSFLPVPPGIAGPARFALQVSGDSMDRIVPDGGFVVIDGTDRDLIDRKMYAVRNGDNETTLKRFRLDPPRLEPESSNPVHKPLIVGSEPFTVIGRAVYVGAAL